jgi:AraC family transcriptional regulator
MPERPPRARPIPPWSFNQVPVTLSVDGMLFPGRRFPPMEPQDAIVPVEAREAGTRRNPLSGLSRNALARALEFMERNLGEDVGLDDIARAACVSRSHFARLFRVSMDDSPMGYLLRLRIERAKTLLARNDQSICAIALALGFFDQSHFSRTFRRLTGQSPSQFARTA